jgi:hypothetical protein
MRPRRIQTLSSRSRLTSSTKADWVTLDGTSSMLDDSLLGSVPYKRGSNDQIMTRNSLPRKEEYNLSSLHSSNATLAEDMEEQQFQHAGKVRNYNRVLRRTRNSQNLSSDEPRLYEVAYDNCYENNSDNSDRRMLISDENYSADEESSYNSSTGWRDSRKTSSTFDDQGRSLPLSSKFSDAQEVLKHRSVQLFNAALDAGNGSNSKAFSATKKWYERYTRVSNPTTPLTYLLTKR